MLNLIRTNIAPVVMSGLIIVFCTWISSQIFEIHGNQRELQAEVSHIKEDTKFMRSFIEGSIRTHPTNKKTDIVKKMDQ